MCIRDSYKDGKLNGEEMRWHANGHLWQVNHYIDDQEVLPTECWYSVSYTHLCTHHCNFCAGICEVHISSGLLGVDYDISAAVSFAGNNSQLGNSSFCERINYFCAVTDDTVVFLRI